MSWWRRYPDLRKGEASLLDVVDRFLREEEGLAPVADRAAGRLKFPFARRVAQGQLDGDSAADEAELAWQTFVANSEQSKASKL